MIENSPASAIHMTSCTVAVPCQLYAVRYVVDLAGAGVHLMGRALPTAAATTAVLSYSSTGVHNGVGVRFM